MASNLPQPKLVHKNKTFKVYKIGKSGSCHQANAKSLESTAAERKQNIHPHPTLSEAVMQAGGAIFGEAIYC